MAIVRKLFIMFYTGKERPRVTFFAGDEKIQMLTIIAMIITDYYTKIIKK